MVEESSGGSDAFGTRPRRRSILGATLPDTRKVAVGADPKTRNKDEKAKDNVVHTTKYNAVTFFPKSMYEQYRRLANVYFTVVAGLSLNPDISPVNPFTTISPLCLVLGISIAKEAIEDAKRRAADAELNSRKVLRMNFSSQQWEPTAWKDIVIGDVVKVRNDEYFPADILVMSTTNDDGVCYVETMNLDGETNLKVKKAMEQTWNFSGADVPPDMTVECDLPNNSLYTFTGKLSWGNLVLPAGPSALLLRGSSLRNTKHIVGAVVYAGHDTKVMMNAMDAPSKRSKLERSMDNVIFFMFLLLFVMCLSGALCTALWTRSEGDDMWYMAPKFIPPEFDPASMYEVGIYSFLTSFILYGYLIPISLYVSMEIVKVFQSMVFINQDRQMYHDETDTPALARTSNLNEELGQVDTVLSDKTGTLTRNVMEFFKCTIAGESFGSGITEVERAVARRRGQELPDESNVHNPFREFGFNFFDGRLMDGMWMRHPQSKIIGDFFRVLAVCHTVICDGEPTRSKIKYEAESPDESALVIAAKQMGFFFKRRGPTSVVVEEFDANGNNVDVEYEILNILEFNSTRKRMSVICRNHDGRIRLFCKGADSIIKDRLTAQDVNDNRKATFAYCEEFALAGLRTLCLAHRELDPTEYDAWQETFVEARTSMHDREQKLMDVAEDIEKELILLGATAIEDKLQEGVPQCIETLGKAGVGLWVLTGDKVETAVNIGMACSLILNDTKQYSITPELDPEVMRLEAEGDMGAAKAKALEVVTTNLKAASQELMSDNSGTTKNCAIIIDGKALVHALATDESRNSFLRAGLACRAVLCCRVSPLQKALVTQLVRSTGSTALAIGDGANDVGMIQAADIGVGISGQEGMQAVMASDFAIAQFRYLERLLLVHGRWSYKRLGRMVCYFFYKNILFGLILYYYNASAFFSGKTVYNEWFMSLFNVFFTSFPVFAVGIFDKDVTAASGIEFPGLYGQGPRNEYFGVKLRAYWILNGLYQSVVTYFLVFAVMGRGISDRADGQSAELAVAGMTAYTCIVLTVSLQLASIIETWTWIHHYLIWGSVMFWFYFIAIYSIQNPDYIGEAVHLFAIAANSPNFWLLLVLIPIACLLPDFLIRAVRRHLYPADHQIIAEAELAKLSGKGVVGSLTFAEKGQVGQRRMSQVALESNPDRLYGKSGAAANLARKISVDGDDPNSSTAHDLNVLPSPVVGQVQEAPDRHRKPWRPMAIAVEAAQSISRSWSGSRITKDSPKSSPRVSEQDVGVEMASKG